MLYSSLNPNEECNLSSTLKSNLSTLPVFSRCVETIRMDGIQAYEAATHCAAWTAAKRLVSTPEEMAETVEDLRRVAGV